MSEKRIVFGSDAEVTSQPVESHWAELAHDWLLKEGLITESSDFVVPSLDRLTPPVKGAVLKWLQPQTIFRNEKTPADEQATEDEVLRYLLRVLYEEMFQINPPDPETKLLGNTSLGGLLTHIPRGSSPAGQSKEIASFVHIAEKTRERIATSLAQPLAAESRAVLTSTFAVDIRENATVEEAFIAVWKSVSGKAEQYFEAADPTQFTSDSLRSFVEELLIIRSLPDFQFLFGGYVFFDSVSVIEEASNQATQTHTPPQP